MSTPQDPGLVPPDPMSLLMQGAYPKVKFEAVGANFAGRLLDIKAPFQGRGFGKDKDKLAFWDSGQPKWVIPFEFDSDNSDDGTVILNVAQGSQMQSCIAQAVLASGAKEPRKGGHLSIALVELKPTDGADQKIYAAAWTPPMAGSGAAMTTQQAPPAQPAAPAVPVQQQPAQPQQPATSPMGDISQYPAEVQELIRQNMKGNA